MALGHGCVTPSYVCDTIYPCLLTLLHDLVVQVLLSRWNCILGPRVHAGPWVLAELGD